MSTATRVSPRRNLTAKRGGSSETTGGGGLGSWSCCGGLMKGALNTSAAVANTSAVKRTAVPRHSLKHGESKYRCCFIRLNKMISTLLQ